MPTPSKAILSSCIDKHTSFFSLPHKHQVQEYLHIPNIFPKVFSMEGLMFVCRCFFCYKTPNDKKHEDHESCKNWYESNPFYHGKFDSEAFDTAKVNAEIMNYLRWSRDRKLMWFGYAKE
jgi:hypothetical protein